MGKHKHKHKHPNDDKAAVVSEADAAAGLMVQKEEKEPPKKRAIETQHPLTRKQKRQKLNDKNKWPQHPKITNPEQRAKAYLRVAGIEAIDDDNVVVNKKPDPLPEDDDTEWRRFGRFLGGTDARTRHKAVKRLSQYLQAKSGFGLTGGDLDSVAGLSELDLLKLWKGLWFTLYMADKVPVQDELSKHIAKLMWCVAGDPETDDFAAQAYLDLEAQEEMEYEQQMMAEGEGGDGSDDEEDDQDFKILETRVVEMEEDSDDEDDGEEEEGSDNEKEDMEEQEQEEENYQETPHIRGAPLAMLMMRTFFRTLVREWGNMDKYRVDKFYTLARYMIREIFRYMAQRQWSLGIIKLFNDAITEEALMKPPNGVRYHLIDIVLDELVQVATSGKGGVLPMTEAIFLEILEPYFTMAQHGFGDKMVQARVMEKVLEKFLVEYSVVSDDREDKTILEEVHVGTVSKFIFEMASTKETLDIHRKSLYEMHKTYERQRKKTGTDIELGTAFQKAAEEEEDEDYHDMEGEKEEEETLEQMGFVAEDNEDSEEEEKEAPVKESKKEKKKKKKKKKQKRQPEDSEEAEETPPEINWERNETKKKGTSADMDTTHHGDATKKGKKHKKKKQTDNDESAGKEEETVTISKAEQKKAKQALKQQEEESKPAEDDEEDHEKSKKNKKKKSKKKDKTEEGSTKRRVSFGNNRARSWKASMQGLAHLDPSEAKKKTPEKSILLKSRHSGKKSPVNKNKTPKGRKRAVDYF